LYKIAPFPTSVLLYDQWLGFAALLSKGMYFTQNPLVYFRRHDTAQTNKTMSKQEYFEHMKLVLLQLAVHPMLNDQQRKYVEKLGKMFTNKATLIGKIYLFVYLLSATNSLFKVRGKGVLSNVFYAMKLSFR
jgi:hypothetical protein